MALGTQGALRAHEQQLILNRAGTRASRYWTESRSSSSRRKRLKSGRIFKTSAAAPAVRYNTVQSFSWSLSRTATARLDLRLSTKDRERIDRAAALAGLPLAAFVRSAVLREADRTFAAETVATLSLTESKRFLAALGKAFAPNAALRRALKRGNELGI